MTFPVTQLIKTMLDTAPLSLKGIQLTGEKQEELSQVTWSIQETAHFQDPFSVNRKIKQLIYEIHATLPEQSSTSFKMDLAVCGTHYLYFTVYEKKERRLMQTWLCEAVQKMKMDYVVVAWSQTHKRYMPFPTTDTTKRLLEWFSPVYDYFYWSENSHKLTLSFPFWAPRFAVEFDLLENQVHVNCPLEKRVCLTSQKEAETLFSPVIEMEKAFFLLQEELLIWAKKQDAAAFLAHRRRVFYLYLFNRELCISFCYHERYENSGFFLKISTLQKEIEQSYPSLEEAKKAFFKELTQITHPLRLRAVVTGQQNDFFFQLCVRAFGMWGEFDTGYEGEWSLSFIKEYLKTRFDSTSFDRLPYAADTLSQVFAHQPLMEGKKQVSFYKWVKCAYAFGDFVFLFGDEEYSSGTTVALKREVFESRMQIR